MLGVLTVSFAGTVTTYAGHSTSASWVDGPLTSARFNQPMDVAMDSNGFVFVADNANNVVRMISNGTPI